MEVGNFKKVQIAQRAEMARLRCLTFTAAQLYNYSLRDKMFKLQLVFLTNQGQSLCFTPSSLLLKC